MISKICFATSNAHKLEEVRNLLPGIVVVGLHDIGCTEVIPEDFETLQENSLQKARFVYDRYHIDCFADDSGLEVSQLNGAPGVHSAYYGGEERDANKNISRLLKELGSSENRGARFVTVITLVINGQVFVFEGELRGSISTEPIGTGGFGYDPIFIPENDSRTLGQYSMDEKNRISHRAAAIQKLADYFQNNS